MSGLWQMIKFLDKKIAILEKIKSESMSNLSKEDMDSYAPYPIPLSREIKDYYFKNGKLAEIFHIEADMSEFKNIRAIITHYFEITDSLERLGFKEE